MKIQPGPWTANVRQERIRMMRFVKKVLPLTAAIFSPLWPLTAVLAQPGRYGGGMPGPGYHGFWGMGWLGLVFWGLILVGVVLAVRALWRAGGRKTGSNGSNRAMDILKERYARGEIDKGQFEAMKKDIES
jgi:putative membrane protein